MTSHGLPKDASACILEQDVVYYGPPEGAANADPSNVGLVAEVHGQSDDEALSDDEEEARPLTLRPRRRRRELTPRSASASFQELQEGEVRILWLAADEDAEDGEEGIDFEGDVVDTKSEPVTVLDRGARAPGPPALPPRRASTSQRPP